MGYQRASTASRTARRGGSVSWQCNHDLADKDHTMVMTHDLREGREFASTGECKVCGQLFRHPLHPDYPLSLPTSMEQAQTQRAKP
jgi:hypothetical protein